MVGLFVIIECDDGGKGCDNESDHEMDEVFVHANLLTGLPQRIGQCQRCPRLSPLVRRRGAG